MEIIKEYQEIVSAIIGVIAGFIYVKLHFYYQKKKESKTVLISDLFEKHVEKSDKYYKDDPNNNVKSSYAKEAFPIISKITNAQDLRINKHNNSIKYFLDDFLYPYFYTPRRKKNDAYNWAILEAFFLSIINDDKLLISNYKLYASATVTSLSNLLRKCKQENRLAIVFIATTQSPGELSMGTSSRFEEKKDTFTLVNESYKNESKKIIQNFIRNNGDLIFERHMFVRRIENEPEFVNGLAMLENVLTRIGTNEEINKSSSDFINWINNNHALNIPYGDKEGAKSMARVQWIQSNKVNRDTFQSDFICTDLIVYGYIEREKVPRAFNELPPNFSNLDIEWQFGIQSIDLGRIADGRAIKLLTHDHLKSESIDFLGFQYRSLNHFIKILQEGNLDAIPNPLGLEKSHMLVDSKPWKDILNPKE